MESDEWVSLHAKYEKRAYSILKKHIKVIVSKIPLGNVTVSNAKMTVIANFDKEQLIKAYQEMYLSIGLSHGRYIVRELSNEKDIGLKSFSDIFQETLFSWMGTNVGSRIVSVGTTLADEIVNIIISSFNNEMNIMQIRNLIYRKLNSPNFYRWQALRIARTETTTIGNYASLQAAKNSKLVLLKEWVSIQDERTRHRPVNFYDHLVMNGVTVGIDEKFNVSNDLLDYPGDTNAEAGDIINCRCGLSFIPKRDKDGNLIKK